MDILAQALLEYETLEGRHVQEILEHGEIRSEVILSGPSRDEEEKQDQEVQDAEEDISDEEEDLGPGHSPAGAPA